MNGITDNRWPARVGGKSGLHLATQGVTPLRRKARNSGTERMSRAMSQMSGTGDIWGAAGVKTAKLCVEQDQIGKRLSAASMRLPGKVAKETE